ncbi:MAG: branched-chain amino acid ABC transporter permease [Betaproteobacteria bacterium]|jgi:branched-chain amino acid transport system permease protein|nr:branched-chain amino acid ABC transporter permease [Betaproteobacteria bacterium]
MSAASARSSLGRDTLWALIALGALLAVPYLTSSRIALDFGIRLAAYGLLATSLNILVGYGGMVSFGHAMFFGGGAYAFALSLQKTGASIPQALLIALCFSAVIGLLVGAVCVRLKEIYFSFLTLAFQMFLHSIILTWTTLTGGDQGLTGGIPRPPFLGLNLADPVHLYGFACVMAVVGLWLMRAILQSPFGYTLRMVRDNADRARFLGIAVWRVKLSAFVLAACFAGMGGVIMALFVSGAFPDFSYWTMSGEAIFMIMMGGIQVFIGPVVGAAVLLLLNDAISRTTEYHGLVLGLVVLLFALGFKRGLMDFLGQLWAKQQR